MYPDKSSMVPAHAAMNKEGRNIDIVLAGQAGVGRSTLINMITGATDGSEMAAKVSNGARPCPIETTIHPAQLEVDGVTLQCSLWDTRGLDEAVDYPNLMDMAANWLRQQGLGLFSRRAPDRDLRNVCRERLNSLNDGGEKPRSASIVILMWCIHAWKTDVSIHWQHFRKVYVEYCDKRVKPVIVITQATPNPEFAEQCETRCKDHLRKLGLEIGVDDILLLIVRKFRDTSSPEYMEDSLALKNFILRLSGRT